MEQLLELLKDGHARTTQLLAMELHTSVEDVNRQMEYLENMGIIKRVIFSMNSCSGCGGCSSGEHGSCNCGGDSEGHVCKGCLPEDGFKNMGLMWEVVK